MASSVTERIQKKLDELSLDIQSVDFEYEYPDRLDWRPGSDLHTLLVTNLEERIQASRRLTDPVKPEWKKLDWTLSAYVPANAAEDAIMQNDWRKPVTVVIPATFASLETFLTYMSSAFLSKPVIHHMSGVGSKRAIIKTALLERVMGRHSLWFKEGLHLTTQWRDAFTYGIGAVTPVWSKHKARKSAMAEVTELLATLLGDMGLKVGDELRYLNEEETIFEGNQLKPLDVYNLILDPNVTVNDIQSSEFFGWMYRQNAMSLVSRETDPEERTFNGKYVRMLASQGLGRSKYWSHDESGRNTRNGTDDPDNVVPAPLANAVDSIPLMVNLIPEEWGVGDSDRPEKWMFELSCDQIITKAHPLNLDHGMYPVTMVAPNTTGHDILPVSYLATTYGLQKAIDHHVKQRFAAVRKNLNDMIIFHPSYVYEEDLLNPEPGKLIRMKQLGFSGQGIDGFIKQLDVKDVTAGHMGDVANLIQMMDQSLGTVDITKGDLSNMPERPTATGINAAQTGALSRLQRIASIIGMQSMNDLTFMMAYQTIQFQDIPIAVSIIGNQEEMLRREYGLAPDEGQIEVNPFDLEPSFEVVPHDGSLPERENSQAWTEIIKILMAAEGNPEELAKRYPIEGLFERWARINGVKDLREFAREGGGKLQPQVTDDETVAKGIQSGNLVSMEEVEGQV